uniref:Uncharacterized protein n=1 Tax=Globodera rostochiensis TaxID=31243 RepID=A0A914IB71_GLORO
MNRSPAVCHRRLLSLLFVFLFLWSTNAQRYGATHRSGGYDGNSKPQHNAGYGGHSSRHGDVEQNNGESGQSNQRWGGWRGRGQWEGQQQQNWGQTHNQEENQEAPQGGTEQSGQYPSRWGHQSSGRFPSNVQPQQPSTPADDNDNSGDNAPPSPPQPHSNSGSLHVDLPPGAPGTSDAGNADQSS